STQASGQTHTPWPATTTTWLPSGVNVYFPTGPSCGSRGVTGNPVQASHTRAELSPPTVTREPPSGGNSVPAPRASGWLGASGPSPQMRRSPVLDRPGTIRRVAPRFGWMDSIENVNPGEPLDRPEGNAGTTGSPVSPSSTWTRPARSGQPSESATEMTTR